MASAGCSTMVGGSPSKPGFYKRRGARRGDVSLGGKKTEPSDDGYTVCEIQAPSMG